MQVQNLAVYAPILYLVLWYQIFIQKLYLACYAVNLCVWNFM